MSNYVDNFIKGGKEHFNKYFDEYTFVTTFFLIYNYPFFIFCILITSFGYDTYNNTKFDYNVYFSISRKNKIEYECTLENNEKNVEDEEDEIENIEKVIEENDLDKSVIFEN